MGVGPGGGEHRLTRRARYYVAIGGAIVLGTGVAVATTVSGAEAAPNPGFSLPVPTATPSSSWVLPTHTTTPIKHVVVIFDENESFDHYFGTYPYAANTDGSPFHAKPGTPKVNGLYTSITKNGPTGPLLTSNPNEYNPQRLTHSQALTCDQNHSYLPEQEADDGGKMDKFVQYTGSSATCNSGFSAEYASPGLVMDYYDGNTVTALWNYAQNFAMSDNDYDTDFGPSSPGAINLISGNDGGGYAVSPTAADPATAAHVTDSSVAYQGGNIANNGTIFGDIDPAYDDCSDTDHSSTSPVGVLTGQNIGNLLDAKNVSWGWFQGGFAPTGTVTENGTSYEDCGSEHENIGGEEVTDYVPHHDPFQFYASTANPKHLPPTSEAAIGHTDQANHQYDLSLFDETLKDGNLPAVSFLKPAAYQNAHPGNSDPLDEQTFLVNTINAIQKSPFWSSTAIIITYDDSDGWYDHQAGPVVNGSDTAQDTAICSAVANTLSSYADRCGYGPRLPLIVISPYTRQNYVSSNLTDTASVIKFIEDNWLGGERLGGGSYDASSGSLDAPGGVLDFNTFPHLNRVILNPATGEVVSSGWPGLLLPGLLLLAVVTGTVVAGPPGGPATRHGGATKCCYE
jgi:phospholipase C